MTLLIDVNVPSWMNDDDVRRELEPHLPGVTIRCIHETFDPAEVRMLAVGYLAPGRAAELPNLELIQKLGAGVETIVSAPDLAPNIRIARLKPDTPAREIAEFCLAYVLRDQIHMRAYEADGRDGVWAPREPRQSEMTTIGLLGLGHIGGRTARLFADLGFRVIGWSRTQKSMDGIDCYSGNDGFGQVLAQADFLICILPSTPDTSGLMGLSAFKAMKPGAVIINVGRGDLIVEEDLVAALDDGPLGGAVLDVFATEPLPDGHPFWTHPLVTITPHVSGWHVTGGFADVAENYRRLVSGDPLLHEVDRSLGY